MNQAPTETKRHKRGDTREDGKRFLDYRKGGRNGEYWITSAQFDAIKARQKEYFSRPEIKAKILAQQKEYNSRPENKARISARQKEYNSRPEIKAKALARQKEYYADPENKVRIRARQKEHSLRPEVRGQRRQYKAEYEKERSASDPLYNLAKRVRRRTSLALQGRGFTKSNTTEEMLGCSFDELLAHIESQFTSGMSWDNRDEWHVDHILPLASASTEEEIIKLCHYTNLQPLWALDNISKGSKLPHELP